MTDDQKQLIHIIAYQMFAIKNELSDDADWQSILKEARLQAVFPLAYQALQLFISTDNESQYAKEYVSNQAANIRNLYYHSELHRLLTDNRIPYAILKGQVSASYYPDPMLRSMGDVDFLIHRADIEKVDYLLKSEGFKKLDYAEKHEYHWAYKKDRVSLELHWDIPGVPPSFVNHYSADVISNAEERIISNKVMMFPSPFHHGLVLLLHSISHMTGKGIGLRHLCDWLVFENSLSEREFLKLFEKPLKDIGLWTFAKVMTKIGVLCFGTARSWCRDADDELCLALLEDILSGGNFGTKDNTRGSQAKLIQNRVTKSPQGSILKNGMVSINEKAKRDYAYCRQKVFLRPVGWAAVVGQYAIRVISGKRNNVFEKKIMNDAMNRQKLYTKLRLFER